MALIGDQAGGQEVGKMRSVVVMMSDDHPRSFQALSVATVLWLPVQSFFKLTVVLHVQDNAEAT